MAFLVIGKIDFLYLFTIPDEVTGEKSSNLRGNYLRQRRLPNMACHQIFHVPNNSKIFLTHLELQRNDVYS